MKTHICPKCGAIAEENAYYGRITCTSCDWEGQISDKNPSQVTYGDLRRFLENNPCIPNSQVVQIKETLEESLKAALETSRCPYYTTDTDEIEAEVGYCYATRKMDECRCRGYCKNCDFYRAKRTIIEGDE